jgi:DNA-binding NtrC family response regulator
VSRSILLVDDDEQVLQLLARFFTQAGWTVFPAAEPGVALGLHQVEHPDLVLLDLHLPGIDGLRLLELMLARDPDAGVIMLTGRGDIATAVHAMRLGAENFLTKPVELAHLEACAQRALEKVELRRRNRFLAERDAEASGLDTLGHSPGMREVARQIALLASSDAAVLLLGETGTGKGWVARLLHSLSPRAHGPFVGVHCAGRTAPQLESEIFGPESADIEAAREPPRGHLEIADAGTFFLDEIGDLAPAVQPAILALLETRRFRRRGGSREIEVDARIVAATHRDLEAAAREGRFREDLLYRLAVLSIHLPPLRERGRTDIADLALRLLADLQLRIGRGPVHIAPDALALLAQYAWPGNIRELRNVLERAMLLAGDLGEILPAHLPPEIGRAGRRLDPDVELPLHELERRHIARVLEHHRGNRVRAARTLGISRATLYDKLGRYGLTDVGRKPRAARDSGRTTANSD